MRPDIEQRERFRDRIEPIRRRPSDQISCERGKRRGGGGWVWLIGGTKDAGNGLRVSGNGNGEGAIQPTFSEGNSVRGFVVFLGGVNFLGVGMVRGGRIIIELYGDD